MQAKENRGVYKNSLDALRKITANEGVLAVYKGLEATIWRHVVWNAVYFGVIDSLRKALPQPDASRRAQVMSRLEPMVLEEQAVEWIIDNGVEKKKKIGFKEYMKP